MTAFAEPEVNWSADQMVEVTPNEPDDFLKVRETLTRIGVGFLGKRRRSIRVAISCINRVDIILFTLRKPVRSGWKAR